MKQMESEEYKRMKSGESYHFDDFLLKEQKKCAKIVTKINNLPFGSKTRENLFANLFQDYGKNTIIKANFECNFGFNISIGDNCYINHNVTILDSYEVIIGNNVFIGPGVIIAPVTHPKEYKNRRNLIIKKIIIEDNAWLGSGAIILPGVKICEGAIIGAGAVVLHDVSKNGVFVGVPAKKIKTIEQ